MESKKSGATVEISAMKQVADALSDLEVESAARVLRWAADIWGRPQAGSHPELKEDASASGANKTNNSHIFSSVADLFAKANAKTDADKALVVAYWFQKFKEQSDIDSQKVNSALKHLGHGVSNITAAFRTLMMRNPQLVIQTRKQGTTQQARKKYRLTTEGVIAVEQMIG